MNNGIQSEKQPGASRREFLRDIVLGGSIVTGGMTQASRADDQRPAGPGGDERDFGISDLRLQTTRIDELQAFYGRDLGLHVQRQGETLTVRSGLTEIVFEAVSQGDPFYHVAFNIPENKLAAAVRWQKQRTPLVQKGSSEIVHFAKWNAHSVFFRDPAGNLLEYIARHDLDNATSGEFTASDILYASEIGVVVDDVPMMVAAAKRELHMGIYRDNGPNFASIGDEHCLLVVVKRDRKWFPARQRQAKVHPLSVSIRRATPGGLTMSEYNYRILAK